MRDEDFSQPSQPTTSGKAIASLVLGLLSFVLWIFASVPAIILGILGLRDVSRSRGRLGGQGLAIAGIVTGVLATFCLSPVLLGLLLPAVQRVRMAANRTASLRQLQQLGLAMANYQDDKLRLPPAVLQEPGEQPYSWRVAILPYLGEAQLYARYNRKEPWDSPSNQQVLAQMPKIYASPGAGQDPTATFYQVLVGKGTAFEGPRGLTFADFTDGASNTFLIVEAADAVPWTQPVDLPYAPTGPLPRLGTRSGSYLGAMADGSARAISRSASEQTLRAFITRNGGEPGMLYSAP